MSKPFHSNKNQGNQTAGRVAQMEHSLPVSVSLSMNNHTIKAALLVSASTTLFLTAITPSGDNKPFVLGMFAQSSHTELLGSNGQHRKYADSDVKGKHQGLAPGSDTKGRYAGGDSRGRYIDSDGQGRYAVGENHPHLQNNENETKFLRDTSPRYADTDGKGKRQGSTPGGDNHPHLQGSEVCCSNSFNLAFA